MPPPDPSLLPRSLSLMLGLLSLLLLALSLLVSLFMAPALDMDACASASGFFSPPSAATGGRSETSKLE